MKDADQHEELKQLDRQLRKAGFDRPVALMTARVLYESDQAKRATHGSSLVAHISELLLRNQVSPSLRLARIFHGPTLIQIDCQRTLGYASAAIACRYGVLVAKKTGGASLVMKNVDHLGALGVYARRIAERGCIGVVTATSKPRIAPWKTHTPVFGTTAIAIGIPGNDSPIVIDTSLGCITTNSLLTALAEGESIPKEVALDAHGYPTTDPQKALEGSILPIGGHKGASLAYAIHLMLHGLAGSSSTDHPAAILILDVSRVLGFRDSVTHRQHTVKSIVESCPEARIPGDNYRK